jgi:hypothetical protein
MPGSSNLDNNGLHKIALHLDGEVAAQDARDSSCALLTYLLEPNTELWRIVVLKDGGIGLLFSVTIRNNETGREILQRLRKQFGISMIHQYLDKILFFREQAIFCWQSLFGERSCILRSEKPTNGI